MMGSRIVPFRCLAPSQFVMSAINRPFFASLQTASWRGIPFAVTGSTLKLGRRVALHEYPYRDQVWVEDLGRAGRRISLSGFLVQDAAYGGGDVIAQRTAMIAAGESGDSETGELVHPSLGRITAALLEFECEERSERGAQLRPALYVHRGRQ